MEHSHNHNESHHAHHSTISKLKGHAGSLEAKLVPFFAKMPHIPQDWRKFITIVAPWLSLIFGVLAIIGLLGSHMFAVLISPVAALKLGFKGLIVLISILISVITAIFSILAFKPLLDMKKAGWDYTFYAFTVSSISSLLTIFFLYGRISVLIGIFIGAYLLFEVRERYN